MLTKHRVEELLALAKDLKAEEMQVLMAAFVLEVAQAITIDYINEELDDYKDQEVYPGVDLWDQGSFMLEDLANEREIAAVINQNNLGPYFDIIIEKKWTARKK